MAFTHIIAHRISRTSALETVHIKNQSDEMSANGKLDELLYKLKSQFVRKGGKSYGRFSSDYSQHPFSTWLQEFRQEKLSFTRLTQNALTHFKCELEKSEVALDTYILFALEKIEAGENLYIYSLEHMSGLYLDGDIALSDSIYLDTNGFTLAAKINISDWEQENSNTFVTILRNRGDKELAEAFTNFIGFSDKHDIKTDTIEFLNAVEEFSQTLDEPTARVTRTKVVNYCLEQNKIGKPVTIQDLSQTLSQEIKTYEPDRFSKFIEQKATEIQEEFIADSSQVRNYIRISGRNDSLSMSFASECLGNEIVYDASSDSLTIKNIPPALKARLLKHLKSN